MKGQHKISLDYNFGNKQVYQLQKCLTLHARSLVAINVRDKPSTVSESPAQSLPRSIVRSWIIYGCDATAKMVNPKLLE